MKRRHRAIGSPTKAEQAHQDLQRADGCAMCHLLELPFSGLQEGESPCGPTRVHHCTTGDLHGQKQLGHDRTIGLGDWHHQGIPKDGLNTAAMKARYGPSLHHHKREFVEAIAERLGERSTAALQRHQDERIANTNPRDRQAA